MDVSISDHELNILIIDDVELLAVTISAALKSMFGYCVDTVYSVSDALEKIATKGGYSAILLDFKMPSTDPYEALQKLNSYNGSRTAIFSGVTAPEVIAKARNAGAVAFIPKDTPIAVLGTIIGDIAASKIMPFPEVLQEQFDPRPRLETTLRSRELRMLALLADGLDLAEAGALLHVAPVIVSIDARLVCQKLASSNLDEAVQKARALGLI